MDSYAGYSYNRYNFNIAISHQNGYIERKNDYIKNDLHPAEPLCRTGALCIPSKQSGFRPESFQRLVQDLFHVRADHIQPLRLDLAYVGYPVKVLRERFHISIAIRV